ncbi:hypothetical protein CXB49_10615 [Chromobacterium sp. ATCC 53434]|uniref:hypothetical protein n=1 Tax=Chromobacterium sp. (strain ATCC 53434 / SC 14030) TaxID=2059672 RepID=UPI000C78E2D4|nr:hypothetical protein [Chromobacterium sp. ATCC 53434]AUH51230.1 hypothetical protein CXB49_10615 [Chromobacterium sp. ATCC 53434]
MKIPYYNDTEHYKTVGTMLVPPGETREVDASMLPDYAAADLALDEDAPVHIVDALLAGPFSELLSAIPVLAREDLEQLGEREQAEGRRKDVLAAVSERLLTLASESLGAPGESRPPLEGEGGEVDETQGLDLAAGESDTATVNVLASDAGALVVEPKATKGKQK